MEHRTYFEDIGAWPKTHFILPSYVIGFAGSLIATLFAYYLTVNHALSSSMLIAIVIALACLQSLLQLVAFLHLGSERASRDKLVVLGCTLFIVGILVAGSLWIMYRLDERMMLDSSKMNQYMNSQSGL